MDLELTLSDDALTTFATLGSEIALGAWIELGGNPSKFGLPEGWVPAIIRVPREKNTSDIREQVIVNPHIGFAIIYGKTDYNSKSAVDSDEKSFKGFQYIIPFPVGYRIAKSIRDVEALANAQIAVAKHMQAEGVGQWVTLVEDTRINSGLIEIFFGSGKYIELVEQMYALGLRQEIIKGIRPVVEPILRAGLVFKTHIPRTTFKLVSTRSDMNTNLRGYLIS